MSNIKDGGQAFPCEQGRTPDGLRNQSFDPGMTLRDYFAAKAMQGTLASVTEDQAWNFDLGAEWCYKVADAMLKAREGS